VDTGHFRETAVGDIIGSDQEDEIGVGERDA